VSEHSQPATLIVGQSDATAVELRLEGPILFTAKVDDIPLLSLDPTKECHEQQVEWEHASESIRIEVDGVSGHYDHDDADGRTFRGDVGVRNGRSDDLRRGDVIAEFEDVIWWP
jgi:hypothetical protein